MNDRADELYFREQLENTKRLHSRAEVEINSLKGVRGQLEHLVSYIKRNWSISTIHYLPQVQELKDIGMFRYVEDEGHIYVLEKGEWYDLGEY